MITISSLRGSQVNTPTFPDNRTASQYVFLGWCYVMISEDLQPSWQPSHIRVVAVCYVSREQMGGLAWQFGF